MLHRNDFFFCVSVNLSHWISICFFRFPKNKKICITIITFTFLFFFMNWINMHLQISTPRKTLSQMSHLKSFFPLWAESICLFKHLFWEKPLSQISHLKSFFVYEQIQHANSDLFFVEKLYYRSYIWILHQLASRVISSFHFIDKWLM